jgi:hypothetical protein
VSLSSLLFADDKMSEMTLYTVESVVPRFIAGRYTMFLRGELSEQTAFISVKDSTAKGFLAFFFFFTVFRRLLSIRRGFRNEAG